VNSTAGATRPKPLVLTEGKRKVRSFVLRQGRFTQAQQRAFVLHWSQYGVEYQGQMRDLNALFGRNAPKVLEIGFGNGDALRASAQQDVGLDYIGIEVHAPGVGRLLNALAEDGSQHVRVYHHDAVEVLQHEIMDGALAQIRIWFPDPWHKKRHHKRRLIQPAFAALLPRKLKPGGILHLTTDWHEYAEHMWDILDSTPGLHNQAGPCGHVPRPPWRIETHFERRGIKRGHGVWDLLYTRVKD